MILNSQTKQFIEVGSKLKAFEADYIVTAVIDCGRCKNITIQDMKTKQSIYAIAVSKCYGMEIL